jgi:CheY-like chemotaxis protein
MTIAEGEELLDAMERDGDEVDLIISDMNLPDGNGLDLVRYVRASVLWKDTPMLILSGDVDSKKVGRAYALGANAYIDKAPRGTSLPDVVSTLYRHWVRDVVTVPPVAPDRVEQFMTVALSLRGRFARLYQRIADRLADNPTESSFWLSRALCESNLTNLFAFLRRAIGEHHFPEPFIKKMEAMQDVTEAQLIAGEYLLDQPKTSRADIYRLMLDMLSAFRFDTLAKSISYLFPVVPVAMTALRDFSIGTVLDVTGWIELHSDDAVLRDRAAELRTDAMSELSATVTAAANGTELRPPR